MGERQVMSMPEESPVGWEGQKGPSGRGRKALGREPWEKQGRELPQWFPNTPAEWLVLLRESCG